ncbi:hypothetical protein EON80_21170 [bacterium]|nr:MAG: hypothetical protein EON80_21170 [bacterium]
MQNLELCPHPRFEGISLLRFDVRDQGDPVEDISFTDGQIDTAGIFDLYHAGQARGFDFPIVCRPGPARWRSVFVCVALIPILVWMSTIPGDSRAPQPDWMPQILTGGLVGLFGLGSMWESLKIMRCEIRADEAGLRWRNVISGWKQVRWEEVSDYYLKRRGNDPHLTKLVSTPLGSLKLDAGTFSEKDMDQLTDLVVEKAVNVRRAGWEER